MLEKVRRKLLHCWWECKLVQPLWKTARRFLKKLKIELPHELAIPLLGTYPDTIIIRKDTCTPLLITVLFITAKRWKQANCPLTDEWRCNGYTRTHTHNGPLLGHKREWNNAICSKREGPTDCLTKGSKLERQIPYDITYMQNLKYDTNELIYETKTTAQLHSSHTLVK